MSEEIKEELKEATAATQEKEETMRQRSPLP